MNTKNKLTTDVVIIGAGTAGLSALKEVTRVTDDFLLIDPGPLGTTCARVGCMPSKLLIESADNFYQSQHTFEEQGILGSNQLSVSIPSVLAHVRKLRDTFTSGIINRIHAFDKKFICGHARFLTDQTITVNECTIYAEKIIIATGSTPIIPPAWQADSDAILTSDTLFEQHDLARVMGVIGGGPIGIEMAQALSRLGIQVTLFHSKNFIAGITDPIVNEHAIQILKNEFEIHLNETVTVTNPNHKPTITSSTLETPFEQLLISLGRRPNLAHLNLDRIGVTLDKNGIPHYDPKTLRVADTQIYIAGDASARRPILHEAADEGYIAGYNATSSKDQIFNFRTPIEIVFSQPNIARVGLSFSDIQNQKIVIGEASFEDQGRARMMSKNKGVLRIYADKTQGLLLGAEMCIPDGEHIAQLLALAIQENLTVFDLLKMPFYHPTTEEGMRTALRDISKQVSCDTQQLKKTLCKSIAAIELLK